MLGAMDIFKYLPASKKLPNSNCKKCGSPTCMMFALKLAKGQANPELCPEMPEELLEKLNEANKIQQKEIELNGKKFGGEKVMFRHEKTFINPTGIFIKLDCSKSDFNEKYEQIKNYEIEIVGNVFKVDGFFLENSTVEILKTVENDGFCTIIENDFNKFQVFKYSDYSSIAPLIKELSEIRKFAIVDRNEKYSDPILAFVDTKDKKEVCAVASSLICKYASIIVLEEFDKAILSSLITLRLNIFTDPEKPLKVDSKIYEFNNPDENSLVFMTTNFALTYFAVSNELSSLKRSSYLIVTPSEGMSVLTAWSAEKITAEIVKKMLDESEILKKIKNKKLIIPGFLNDLKPELEAIISDWEIVIGTQEAYKIPATVETYDW